MQLDSDLLALADHLARRERRRPRQATLRRAVSTAYYALFHLLVGEAVRLLAPGRQQAELRRMLARAFSHREMKAVCQQLTSSKLPADLAVALGACGLPRELVQVAKTFCLLQSHRQAADYDLGARFERIQVLDQIEKVRAASLALATVRRHPATRLYLTALLAGTRWSR
jgi:hypothetical protein